MSQVAQWMVEAMQLMPARRSSKSCAELCGRCVIGSRCRGCERRASEQQEKDVDHDRSRRDGRRLPTPSTAANCPQDRCSDGPWVSCRTT